MTATQRRAPRDRGFFHRNGLSLVLTVMFVAALIGQSITGHLADNAERREHGEPVITFTDYLASGAFASATFENWESEFLQMGVYVLLTVWLLQRGSAESRPLDPKLEAEEEALERRYWDGPTPRLAQVGGVRQWLYAHSLALALFGLFALSFVGHLVGSWRHAVHASAMHGEPTPTLAMHLTDAGFWFESFQNWQSEFLAVLMLVVLSIFLRQEGSPLSKPVEAPHSATGR